MNSRNVFLTVLEAWSLRSWCQQVWCLVRTHLLGQSRCLFAVTSCGKGGKGALGGLFPKGTNPSPLSKAITLGTSAQELSGGRGHE